MGTRIGFSCYMDGAGWGMKRCNCCFSFGQQPRMAPPAGRTRKWGIQLSLFAQGPLMAEDAASSLFVFAVYHAFRYVVFGTYTMITRTNRTSCQAKLFDTFAIIRYDDEKYCCCCIFCTTTAGRSGSDAVVAVHVWYVQVVAPYLVSARTT